MIPWPIALLTLYFGALASASAASLWRIVAGDTGRPWAGPAAWLIVTAGATLGLALMKPWGRWMAMSGAYLVMATGLGVAAALVASQQAGLGLLSACGAGAQMLIIRYLRRPMVSAWFDSGKMTGGR